MSLGKITKMTPSDHGIHLCIPVEYLCLNLVNNIYTFFPPESDEGKGHPLNRIKIAKDHDSFINIGFMNKEFILCWYGIDFNSDIYEYLKHFEITKEQYTNIYYVVRKFKNKTFINKDELLKND